MRHKKAPVHTVQPDAKYGDVVVAKLINHLMRKGKKAVAEHVVYAAFDRIQKETGKDPREVFEEAVRNVGPTVETRSRRVAGATYQIPLPVRPERRLSLALRWLITSTRFKKGKPFDERLAGEIVLAAKGEGDAVKKRMDVHRMAEANKAFAHFAR